MIDHVGPVDFDHLDAEDCRRSLWKFFQRAWPILEPNAPLRMGWHVQALCEVLEALLSRQIHRAILVVPPRHLKSSIASVAAPAWQWLREPGFKIIGASYAESLAIDAASKSRRLIDSGFYRALNRRPDGSPIFTLQGIDQQKQYGTDKDGRRYAVGVGGATTGFGCNLLLIDDATSAQQAQSDLERKEANDWFSSTAASRHNDPRSGLTCVIGQRLHRDDLPGTLLARDGTGPNGWTLVEFPLEHDPARRTCVVAGLRSDGKPREIVDPRTEPGELLCPEHLDRAAVDRLRKSMGVWHFEAQYNGHPSIPGGQIFREEWLTRRWGSPTHPGLPMFSEMIISCDLAATGKDGASSGSFSVMQVWGVAGPEFYLIDQVRGRWPYPVLKQHLTDLIAKHSPVNRILVEDAAHGRPIIAELSSLYSGVCPVPPKGSKESRASAVTALVQQNVWIPHSAPWVDDFVRELTAFPNGANDDQVDAMVQVLGQRFVSPEEAKRAALPDKWKMWAQTLSNPSARYAPW